MKNLEIYKSGELHNQLNASKYSQTHDLAHRFLAYRDFPKLIEKFTNINKVLDLGSGTGASTNYLYEMGYEVIGIDKSLAMIEEAKFNFPEIDFIGIEKFNSIAKFDLVFSSFVLFELSNKQEIIDYLNLAASALREEGIFFAITGSENLHQPDKDWLCFNVDYKENYNPSSGSVVKLGLNRPKMEFLDFYWKESDYKECFQASNLELLAVHYPIGRKEETFNWKDELSTSPFVIFIAKKRSK